jgi:hypothetical protein
MENGMPEENDTVQYRPGQLWEGRDGDYLFVILVSAGLRFVTVRGEALANENLAAGYLPMTLLREVT